MPVINEIEFKFSNKDYIHFYKAILGFNAALHGDRFVSESIKGLGHKITPLGFWEHEDKRLFVYFTDGDYERSQIRMLEVKKTKDYKLGNIEREWLFSEKLIRNIERVIGGIISGPILISFIKAYNGLILQTLYDSPETYVHTTNDTVLKLFDGVTLNMILGAGVSNDYGARSWKCIIEDIKNAIHQLRSDISCSELKRINDDVYNTTYGYPQILKTLNEKEKYKKYYECIYQGLYDKRISPLYQTTLKAVANALNRKPRDVLTFNYDDYLEYELKALGNNNYEACFKGNYKQLKNVQKHKIIHAHGYMPYDSSGNILDGHKKSIVFSNDEYIDAYSSKNEFAYKMLVNHLKNRCVFIGNSISDYEEQKVIKLKFERIRSSYHICIMKKGNLQVDAFKFSYFLRMGILIYWVDDFDEIAKTIKLHC